MMSKKIQAQHLGKLYREFSRQKYSKYKHQFPKMRESEIVSKIIHEWDAMDIDARHKLQQLYENNRFLIKEEQQPESGKKTPESKLLKSEAVRCEENPTSAKMTPLREEEQQNDKISSGVKLQASEANSNVEQMRPGKQRRKIWKLGRRDYLTFFKHYFEEFRREHPKWNQKQISYTIGLLWRKRKLQYRLRLPRPKQPKPAARVSGRALFKLQNKLAGPHLAARWNILPLQSKQLWNATGSRAGGTRGPKQGVAGKMTLKSCEQRSPFSFLNNR